MTVVTHHVIPKRSHPEYSTVGGGYAVSFVNQSNPEIAAKIAAGDIDGIWQIKSREQISKAKREDYRDDQTNLDYYDRALTETVLTVIHVYPREESDKE